jgi:mono/diheme cytochrome c family protein
MMIHMRTVVAASFLCALGSIIAACAADRLPAQRAVQDPPVDPLARAAYAVIRDNCWGCHGEPGKQAYGELAPVDWILDYDKLIDYAVVIPGKPGKSRLVYIVAVEGKMPRKFDEHGVPRLPGELSEEGTQILIDWIKAGAPRW